MVCWFAEIGLKRGEWDVITGSASSLSSMSAGYSWAFSFLFFPSQNNKNGSLHIQYKLKWGFVDIFMAFIFVTIFSDLHLIFKKVNVVFPSSLLMFIYRKCSI